MRLAAVSQGGPPFNVLVSILYWLSILTVRCYRRYLQKVPERSARLALQSPRPKWSRVGAARGAGEDIDFDDRARDREAEHDTWLSGRPPRLCSRGGGAPSTVRAGEQELVLADARCPCETTMGLAADSVEGVGPAGGRVDEPVGD